MNYFKIFQVNLTDLLQNKYYLMKYTGMGNKQIDDLPYYEFENLMKTLKK